MTDPAILSQPTLVLNRLWQPVNVASLRRALVLVCRGAARIVDPGTYEVHDWESWQFVDFRPGLRTAGGRRIAVPEVITLTGYDRRPQGMVSFSKRNVLKRDRFTSSIAGCSRVRTS